jgi:hypothetical protein
MNTTLRIINTLLLAAILAVLMLMFKRMPVTLADVRNAKPEDRKAMLLKQSLVRLTDTVSVSVENSSLSVEIENVPLSVQIER